jgi:hypothetical protein
MLFGSFAWVPWMIRTPCRRTFIYLPHRSSRGSCCRKASPRYPGITIARSIGPQRVRSVESRFSGYAIDAAARSAIRTGKQQRSQNGRQAGARSFLARQLSLALGRRLRRIVPHAISTAGPPQKRQLLNRQRTLPPETAAAFVLRPETRARISKVDRRGPAGPVLTYG